MKDQPDKNNRGDKRKTKAGDKGKKKKVTPRDPP
jgi:hypothetical protein